jgi:hypothetical protein
MLQVGATGIEDEEGDGDDDSLLSSPYDPEAL